MKREKLSNRDRGMSMIEVLVSLSILSATLLACMALAINSMQRCRTCLWDTDTISSYSAFFERLQLYPNRLMDEPKKLADEIERFKQSLPYQSPLISIHLLEQDSEQKLLMVRHENSQPQRDGTKHLETPIQ